MASKSEDAKAELDEHPVASYPVSGQQESNGSGPADDEASTATKIRGRKDQCQVEDCVVDLTKEGKAYCVKRRLCIEHMRADAVKCRGQDGLFRFCFQCGKLEPLSRFEGMKRSCRARLAQRKQREARRCNSDVAYRFNRSQQNLMRQQQQLAGQHAHTSSGLAGLLPDIHEELLPLQLHDLDYCDEFGEAGQQQQQLLPMINPAYMMASSKGMSFSSSLAPLVEDSACHSMPLPAHCLSDSNNTAAATAVMSGGLHTQGSFSCMRDANGSFTSNTAAANADANCSNCAGHAAQQQWQQQQQQVLQMQQLMRASFGSGTVQPNMAVSTGAGAMSVPLPAVSELAAQHHAASGSFSGPLHTWTGAGGLSGMTSLSAAQLSGLSVPQPGQAATANAAAAAATAAQHSAASGCNSAPLPSLLGVPVAPRHGTAAAVAAAAQRQAADFGLDADLLHECLMHLSTDSNVVDERLPYSDTDLRNLLEGALESAAHAQQQQQQPAVSAVGQQQQQPQVVPLVGSTFLAAGAAGGSACSSQTRTLQAMNSMPKPPAVPMRCLSIAGMPPQQQQLAAGVLQSVTAPLPSIPERRMSKAAVLEQLHRIQQEQMVLLQQLHMQEAASSWMAPDVAAASAAGSASTLTEDVLQTRLQLVQQQYTQMLLEVQNIKQLNQMGLDPGVASCMKFEA